MVAWLIYAILEIILEVVFRVYCSENLSDFYPACNDSTYLGIKLQCTTKPSTFWSTTTMATYEKKHIYNPSYHTQICYPRLVEKVTSKFGPKYRYWDITKK